MMRRVWRSRFTEEKSISIEMSAFNRVEMKLALITSAGMIINIGGSCADFVMQPETIYLLA